MNHFRHLLMLPWMALSDGARRPLAIGAAVLAGLGTIGAAFTHTHSDAWAFVAIHITALLVLIYWAVVMSSSLLLLHTGSRLRLPALTRDVCASLALHAAITIGLPALVLGALGGHLLLALVEIALGAGLGMGYASLPILVGTWLCLIPALSDATLARWLPMPARSVDGFLAWAGPCAIVLWLVIGGFWRSVTRRDDGLDGLRRPFLLNLRSKAWYGQDAAQRTAVQTLRHRWRWLQSTANLRGCGPGHAVRSLRVMLGGWAMPQTPASQVRLTISWGAVLGLVILFVILHDDGQAHGDPSMALTYAALVAPLFAVVQAQALQRRWSRHNGELPLLALLPGLGSPAQIKRHLIRASLLPNLAVPCLCLVFACGVAFWLHAPMVVWVMLVLDQWLGLAMLVAYSLAIWGGLRADHWGYRSLGMGVVIGTSIIAGVAASGIGTSPAAIGFSLLVLAVIYAALLTPLMTLGVRGWRAFQRRPHPFLVTA